MSVLIIADWIFFSKALLVKLWSIVVALVLVILVGLWITFRNPFLKTR